MNITDGRIFDSMKEGVQGINNNIEAQIQRQRWEVDRDKLRDKIQEINQIVANGKGSEEQGAVLLDWWLRGGTIK